MFSQQSPEAGKGLKFSFVYFICLNSEYVRHNTFMRDGISCTVTSYPVLSGCSQLDFLDKL